MYIVISLNSSTDLSFQMNSHLNFNEVHPKGLKLV